MDQAKYLPEHIRQHIGTIAEQERQFHSERTVAERLSHFVGGFVGSYAFIAFHVAWFGIWLLINCVPNPYLRAFDPFPFPLLAIIIEVEGIFLASFILMRQTLMNRRSSEREHLMLQVLLLAEREITTLIDIERRKSLQQGNTSISHDDDVKTFSQLTSVDDLARTLQQELPSE